MRITALLTGRGNNTLADKNILPVLGKPLLYYPAMAAKRSRHVTDFFISSDCDKILSASEALGYTRIQRPSALALPDAQHGDVIRHALEQIGSPDILVVLLANSGTVKTAWIDACIQLLLDDPSLSAAIPAYEYADHHPFRAKTLSSEGLCIPFFDFEGQTISTNRQDLPPCHFFCHNFWVLRVAHSVDAPKGQQPWTFMGNRIKPFVIEGSFDVHTEEDLKKTEAWILAHLTDE